MELTEARRRASELSGGTSSSVIKDLVTTYLETENTTGSLLDFGAGKGELLERLSRTGRFTSLCGIDLFSRSAELTPEIRWIQQDLNDPVGISEKFDTVICSEVIEHLENPRQVFRSLKELVKPGGILLLTMPNQESVRSYLSLVTKGHFIFFTGDTYPAHITALLRLDLARMCEEVGFLPPRFLYTNTGAVPKMARISWQKISFGLLKGRLFSDNVAMVAKNPN